MRSKDNRLALFAPMLAMLAGAGLMFHSTHAAPATPDTLEQRLKACTACHAPKDRQDAFFPRIAGKPAGYLYHQLLNFRDGRRQYPLMTYMVEHLPDAYLHEIAVYFSEQHPTTPPAQASTAGAAVLARGRQLVRTGDATKKSLPASAVTASA